MRVPPLTSPTTSDAPVAMLDIAPTVAELAGAPAGATPGRDRRSRPCWRAAGRLARHPADPDRRTHTRAHGWWIRRRETGATPTATNLVTSGASSSTTASASRRDSQRRGLDPTYARCAGSSARRLTALRTCAGASARSGSGPCRRRPDAV